MMKKVYKVTIREVHYCDREVLVTAATKTEANRKARAHEWESLLVHEGNWVGTPTNQILEKAEIYNPENEANAEDRAFASRLID